MRLVIKMASKGSGVYRAWCPSLPGCEVYGQTRQDVRWRIHKAIEGYLASLDVALPRELNRLQMEQTAAQT